MKIKYIITTILSGAFLLAGCTSDSSSDEGNMTDLTIHATLETGLTSFGWDSSDAINVYDKTNTARTFSVKATSQSDSKTAQLNGSVVKSSSYAAFFPASANAQRSGSAFTANLPRSQEAIESNIAASCNFSVGEFLESNTTFQLKSAVAYLSFSGTYNGRSIKSVTLTADAPVCGPAEIKLENKVPAITVKDGSKSIELSGDIQPETAYIFAVWPGSYEDVNLTVTASNGTTQTIKVGKVTATRNTVKRISTFSTSKTGWSGPADGEEDGPYDTAEGTILWSDGTPATGITVSDGFNVAVTDALGKYALETSSDTWYIYFSYPENAKITTSNGCPEFFKKYDNMTKTYDFTLTKQAVENEFALFALADPQAHYAARGKQTSADTYRFQVESVPAINKQIAAQTIPSYGITLGDIVYSEDSRNSNPGLTTMRDNIGKISMPVFQVIGNHDYTYYYGSSNPLTTDATSSTLQLKVERAFENTFGPINFSFNRGNVHIVSMKNVYFDSTTDAGEYHCAFTDSQWKWLQADLANVPKTKSVILCVHIPLTGCSATENYHVMDVLNLIKQYTNSTVFSGHTHYYRGSANVNSSGLYEHIHSAVCGQWWWSNMEGDGCPNGYTVYDIKGTEIKNAYFIGINDGMNTKDYQMRIYRGDITNGGSYAYFKWMQGSSTLLINVFNGDSRWNVQVYENGVLKGNATLMSNSKKTYSSVTAGQTYEIPTTSNQDWWAIGYHIGVVGRGTSSTSYYTNMFHMWKYTMSNPSATIKVVATDPYGNQYTCTDVVTKDCDYPSIIKAAH